MTRPLPKALETSSPFDEYPDLIHGPEIIERLESVIEALEDKDSSLEPEEREDLLAEKAELEKFIAAYSGEEDFEYSIFIGDSYFEEYAERLASDVVESFETISSRWPFNCIDWEMAARDLKTDYTPIQYGEQTFWYRS